MKLQNVYFELTICGKWKLVREESNFKTVCLAATKRLYDVDTDTFSKPVKSILRITKNTYTVEGVLSMYDGEVLNKYKFREIKKPIK